MGFGDQLMATGMARGAKARGKRIAFGDRHRIIWDQHSELVFRGNPNIAKPGSERDADIEWVEYFKGRRIYNHVAPSGDRWVWNPDFRPTPGEMFFDPAEIRQGARYGRGFVLIEPSVVAWKSSSANKDWGRANYQQVADRLRAKGLRVVQFRQDETPALSGVEALRGASFRDALAILTNARLYVGAEGGLHHGAAAVGVPGVVLFGGFIPPSVTGYDGHANITGGAVACGSLKPCAHCKAAMAAINVDEVFEAAMERL